MILVVDASVLVAALVDSGPDGEWAALVLADRELAAPHLMPIEWADILRRAALAGEITSDAASLAHGDLLELRIELWPYVPLADRCWQLRGGASGCRERGGGPRQRRDRRLAARVRRG